MKHGKNYNNKQKTPNFTVYYDERKIKKLNCSSQTNTLLKKKKKSMRKVSLPKAGKFLHK